MDLEHANEAKSKNDNRRASLPVSSRKYSRVMAAIALAVLQILLLLLKAYFAKDQDKERVIEHLRAAQAALDSVASQFERAIRYLHPKSELVDQIQDQLDEDKNNHTSTL
jgi:hypothetical protein